MLKNALFVAQLNPTLGALEKNFELMLAALERAQREGAPLLLFPGEALSGAPSDQLSLWRSDFEERWSQLARELASHCRHTSALTGYSRWRQGRLERGLILWEPGAEPKYLPLGEDDPSPILRFQGLDLPVLVGLERTPTSCERLAAARAELSEAALIVRLVTRPYVHGRWLERADAAAREARQNASYLVELNLAGGQDQYIWEGGSALFTPQGRLAARASLFKAEEALWQLVEEGAAPPSAPFPSREAEHLAALQCGLGDYMRKNSFSDVVLGISGGIDSALCAALAVLTLGSERVHGLAMPSRYTSDLSNDEGAKLCRNLGIDLHTFPIEGPRQSVEELLAPLFADRAADLTEENLQARLRAILVMATSNKFGWLALCTGNKSEEACGYSTLYGDGAGGLAPIADLYKTEVWALCRHINEISGRELIPQAIIDRPPSAELRPKQKDSDSLPEYEVLDRILELYLEGGQTPGQIAAAGFPLAEVQRIVRLVEGSEFKRRQSPTGLKVSSCLLGTDRALPITNRFR